MLHSGFGYWTEKKKIGVMRCTNCGWDNADQNTRCEKCNSPLEGSMGNKKDYEESQGKNNGSTVRETIRETLREESPYPKETEPIKSPSPTAPESKPISGAKPYGGTINTVGGIPYGAPMMNYCKLTPMPSVPDEKHLPKESEFKGDYIELNRDNLDPDNFTISQNAQAILTCKNGKWYIKDQSHFKTTYVLASEEIPLKNGDVILMGSRRFIFTED